MLSIMGKYASMISLSTKREDYPVSFKDDEVLESFGLISRKSQARYSLWPATAA